ncbi:hypothetical protein A2U01_0066441, partial [Trifolium medium]|nr:hypothetical protein [Trifolium medium]
VPRGGSRVEIPKTEFTVQ